MPDAPHDRGAVRGRWFAALGISLLTAGSFAAALAQSVEAPAAPSATSENAPAETAGQVLERLTGSASRDLARNDLALRTALEFCIATGAADGKRAAAVVDVVGYQALPLTGKLPETAQKPVAPSDLAEEITRRSQVDVAAIPATAFATPAGEELSREFPAAARWILPAQDVVLRITPHEVAGTQWPVHRACLVVRIRGQRATIVAGSLLEALQQSPSASRQ